MVTVEVEGLGQLTDPCVRGAKRMSGETFLLTGAMGCIGAWTLRNLVREGVTVVATDLATDPVRPRLVMGDDELAQVNFVQLDVTDWQGRAEVVEEHGVTHIVHLAGLQVPFCRANPSLGARSMWSARSTSSRPRAHNWGQVKGLAYASSLAVLGPAELYPETPVQDDVPLVPATLYGVYKQANEGTARIYLAGLADSQRGAASVYRLWRGA